MFRHYCTDYYSDLEAQYAIEFCEININDLTEELENWRNFLRKIWSKSQKTASIEMA